MVCLGNRVATVINRLGRSADKPGGSFPVINVSDGIPDSLSLSPAAFVFNDAGQAGKAVGVQVHNHPGQVSHPAGQAVDSAKGVVSFSGHNRVVLVLGCLVEHQHNRTALALASNDLQG